MRKLLWIVGSAIVLTGGVLAASASGPQHSDSFIQVLGCVIIIIGAGLLGLAEIERERDVETDRRLRNVPGSNGQPRERAKVR